MGSKLLVITNRKSHKGFRLVPKSVTLNNLERRNGRVYCIISPNSVAFEAYYVKVVEDAPILQQKCSANNAVSGDISFMAIFAGDHPYRGH